MRISDWSSDVCSSDLFLMEYDRMEFLDAVEELAKRAGIEVPRDAMHHDNKEDSQPLYAALDAAARFFAKQLQASDNARAYLQRRGVDAARSEERRVGKECVSTFRRRG